MKEFLEECGKTYDDVWQLHYATLTLISFMMDKYKTDPTMPAQDFYKLAAIEITKKDVKELLYVKIVKNMS